MSPLQDTAVVIRGCRYWFTIRQFLPIQYLLISDFNTIIISLFTTYRNFLLICHYFHVHFLQITIVQTNMVII